jgi:uncharacterized membrane protein YraQ (UPF0718 family)
VNAYDQTYGTVVDAIIRFGGILNEALPWVVVGATFAGLVQELPSRRVPAVMLGLGLAILVLTMSPLPVGWNIALACAVALATTGLLLLAQPAVDLGIHFLGRRRHLAIAMSGLLGLVNPMCDCGVIVVMRRLLRKGMPLSCCTAYILAGPIINVLVMATTYQAFSVRQGAPRGAAGSVPLSWGMLGLRLGLGYVVAVVTGFLVERLYRRFGNSLLAPTLHMPSGLPLIEGDEYEHPPPRSLWQRVSNISETALHDFVDVTVFLILGAFLAGVIRQYLDPREVETVSRNQPVFAIALMMGLAFLITLCSETDAFVIANFTLAPTAKLAFLVFGPMLDLKLFFMYTRVFRPRLMWTIIGAVAVQVFLYCYLTHLFLTHYAPSWGLPPLPAPTPSG